MTSKLTTEWDFLSQNAASIISKELVGSYISFENSMSIAQCDQHRSAYLLKGLREYSKPTLRKIIAISGTVRSFQNYTFIDHSLSGVVPMSERLISEYLHLAHLFTENEVAKLLASAFVAIESLWHYEGLTPWKNDQEYPELRTKQCTTILTLIHSIKDTSSAGDHLRKEPFSAEDEKIAWIADNTENAILVLRDERLRRLITTPDTDLNMLSSIVSDRGVFGFEDIMSLLDAHRGNPSPALGSGIL